MLALILVAACEMGSGNIVSQDRPVDDFAVVEVSGGAHVVVNVTTSVEGSVSGGASLTIEGEPSTQNVDVSGGANLDG